MWRLIGLATAGLAIVIVGFSLVDVSSGGDIQAQTVLRATTDDISGYARATEPREWRFPQDHAPHPDFLSEWWYYTGNLTDEDGRRFGFQYTLFRRAIAPPGTAPTTDSEWRTRQLYMAHFTISDVQNEQHYSDARFSRGAVGLAGAEIDPVYRVWMEDWEMIGDSPDADNVTFRAATDAAAVNLRLTQAKPIVLHGDNGLSMKGDNPGEASYYYTIPRLRTEGTVTIGNTTFEVTGNTWMDREWSTNVLPDDAIGWDWFSMIFEDNTELVVGRVRRDGGNSNGYTGLYIREDGTTVSLPVETFTISPTRTWTSPHTGGEYPVAWKLLVDEPVIGEPLALTVESLFDDQELGVQPTYWEGAVRITGDKLGYGFVELTGYTERLTDFFQ